MSASQAAPKAAGISGIWAVVTILISIVTAIVTSSITIYKVYDDVQILKARVATLTAQLSQTSPASASRVDYNGSGYAHCDSGSVINGLTISVDPNLNTHGQLWCVKVQPAVSP